MRDREANKTLPYKPCTECGADCEMWTEGNPKGCAGEAEAAGEVDTEDPNDGGWRWVHECATHRGGVM
jgi:hypothetical protein